MGETYTIGYIMIKLRLAFSAGATKGEPRLWDSGVPSSKRNEGVLLPQRSFRGDKSFPFFIQNFALLFLGLITVKNYAGTAISGGPGEMERAK